MAPDLTGKRILLLGAETELGAEMAQAVGAAGASFAVVATSNDAATAFDVKRLARRTGATLAQAIDATNEMAVRVMARQVSKELGGLDAVVFCGPDDGRTRTLALRLGQKELSRFGGGVLVDAEGRTAAEAFQELVEALAGPPASE